MPVANCAFFRKRNCQWTFLGENATHGGEKATHGRENATSAINTPTVSPTKKRSRFIESVFWIEGMLMKKRNSDTMLLYHVPVELFRKILKKIGNIDKKICLLPLKRNVFQCSDIE